MGVGRDPRLGRDRAPKPVIQGETRIRKNGDAIRSPAHTAAQSIVKIVLFRQDMVASPFVEGLALVVMNWIWACGGRAEVTAVTMRPFDSVTVVTVSALFSQISGKWRIFGPFRWPLRTLRRSFLGWGIMTGRKVSQACRTGRGRSGR